MFHKGVMELLGGMGEELFNTGDRVFGKPCVPYLLEPAPIGDMGLPVETLTRLLTGDASITSEVAQKLGEYCGTTTGFWVNLQAQYNEDTKQHTAHI